MPHTQLDRAIVRGAGNNEADNVAELSYEGYAPGGVAIIVEAMTDNRNRTAAEVRHAFTQCGGNLGTDGSVAYMFDRKGQISFAAGVSEDALMEAALEAGADDVEMAEDGSALVSTSFSDFHAVNEALNTAGLKAVEAEIAMIPSISAPISDLETAQKVIKLIDMLEDLDDVQEVYHNAEIPDAIMEQLG
jgi:YebC/PmpR family DNA-binding regulatory protein